MSTATSRPPRLRFSHFGLSVQDIHAMERFYCDLLGFSVTDRGEALGFELVFLSRSPEDHHQIVLATGKPGQHSPQHRQPDIRPGDQSDLVLGGRARRATPAPPETDGRE